MRCSAERPCSPKASRSPRTSFTRLSALTRPNAAVPAPTSRNPVWHGSSATQSNSVPATSTDPSRNSASTTPQEPTSTSARPVQPDGTTSWARYSSAARPTAAAFTRSGMSLVTSTTGPSAGARSSALNWRSAVSTRVALNWRSAARLSAQAKMRLSFPSVRKPAGSTSGSVWLSSTRTVPPASPTGTGASNRPWVIRRSSSCRNASRANQPSSSSEMTTSGSTT